MALEAAAPGPVSSPPRFLRGVYVFSLLVSLGATVAICFAARSYEKIFNEMEMKSLPAPTEGLLALGRFVRTTPGLLSVAGLAAVLSACALKGLFDKVLIKLIVAHCIWATLMLPFGYLSLHMPVVQIQQNLESK